MSRIDLVTGAPRAYMHLVGRLAGIPDRAADVLRAHPGADLLRPPAGEEWSGARVLAHMISYARQKHRFLYCIAWMTDPVFDPWDDAAEVEAEGWTRLGPADLVKALRREIAPTVELLSETPDAAWGRPGIHSVHGRRSLRQQVEHHIEHMDQHLRQLDQMLTNR